MAMASVLAAFLSVWIWVIFAGPEIKLNDAPKQDGCFINHIAEHFNIPDRMDCSDPDASLISVFALFIDFEFMYYELKDEVCSVDNHCNFRYNPLTTTVTTGTTTSGTVTTTSGTATTTTTTTIYGVQRQRRANCENINPLAPQQVTAAVPDLCAELNDEATEKLTKIPAIYAKIMQFEAMYAYADETPKSVTKVITKTKKIVRTVEKNPDIYAVLNALQSKDDKTVGRLGEDRFISPWSAGKTMFGGTHYECSETLFANDVGDYFNFLMGNVCHSALEMRCIYDRMAYIIMGISSCSLALLLVYVDTAGAMSGPAKTGTLMMGIFLMLIIIVLPIIGAVQTGKSATRAFAAPGTNKHIGGQHEFGVLRGPDDDGSQFFASLLRLGTIPHEEPGQCGMEWSESVYALLENLLTPAVKQTLTGGAADDGELELGAISNEPGLVSTIIALLDMLKYSVELTPFFYLRLATVPMAVLLSFYISITWAMNVNGSMLPGYTKVNGAL